MLGFRSDEDEGQVVLPLILFVVVLLFFGLVFFQVGSASDQKIQTQTATDSAAVAGAHVVRDAGILQTARTMPGFQLVFGALPGPTLSPTTAACAAALSNWDPGAHQGHALSCVDLTVDVFGGSVHSALIGPSDVVAAGPVDASSTRVKADATARVAASGCPVIIGSPLAKAAADSIADAALISMGAPNAACLTPPEALLLAAPGAGPAVALELGGPQRVLDAVRRSIRVEIVD